MKRLLFIIVSFALSVSANAQNINGYFHYRADGKIKKQEVDYHPATENAQDIIWDLSKLKLPGKKHVVNYSCLSDTDSIIVGTENSTRYYYHQSADSLLLCGYENNKTHVVYDRPELLLHTPLNYGEQHSGLFHGTIAYCEKMFMRVFGSYEVSVDGTGSMVLPSGDTLRHVSRVHIRKLTTEEHYPHIMTEQELRTYVDSIAPYNSDSIRQQMQEDTLQTETNIYRWYALGYRYPVLETVQIGTKDNNPYYTVSYYLVPEEQENLPDKENEQLRQWLADNTPDRHESNNHRENNITGNPNLPVKNLSVTVQGSSINITYELTEDATVTALVCDITGVVYRQSSQSEQAGDTCQMNIMCNGLRQGEYVVYVNINGQVTSVTVKL